MHQHIKSGQLVTVIPFDSTWEPSAGDIVFCRVRGNNYVHLVKKVDREGRALICNAQGKENGWATQIYGKITAVED